MKVKYFEDLEIWKEAIKLAKEVYYLTKKEKLCKDYSLCDQIKRSVVSISANIAEGFDRGSNLEFARFLKIAKGSASETRSHLYVALEIEYISEEDFNSINERLKILNRQIGKLVEYLKQSHKKSPAPS
jgi:four helix bundle protein